MSDDRLDPSGSTEAFRAFVTEPEPPAPSTFNPRVIIAAAVVGLVVIGVLAFLATR